MTKLNDSTLNIHLKVANRSQNITESLTNLRQKLDEITGFDTIVDTEQDNIIDDTTTVAPVAPRPPALIPRSAYMEDNSMKELHEKLMSLSSMSSSLSVAGSESNYGVSIQNQPPGIIKIFN